MSLIPTETISITLKKFFIRGNSIQGGQIVSLKPMIRFKFFSIFSIFVIFGCGSGSNLNSMLFVSSADKERVENQVQLASVHYDAGEYDEAIKILEQVEKITPHHTQALQLHAFSELGLAGFGLFDVIEKIIEINTPNVSVSSSKNLLLSASDTGDILDKFSILLEIGEEDIASLGTESDLPNNSILAGLSVFIPNYPGSHKTKGDPREAVNTLYHLNRALEVICPLIPEIDRQIDGVIKEGSRYDCTSANKGVKNSGQSYLVFALSHLLETLAFNSVLLYSSTEGSSLHLAQQELKNALFMLTGSSSVQSSSNIFKRISKIQEASSSVSLNTIGDYTEAMAEVASNVKAIFDTNEGSMLYETMNNLEKTVLGFAGIPGVPEDVTKSIRSALDNVKKVASEAGDATNSISNQTGALQDKLGGEIISGVASRADELFDKIDELQAESGEELTECNKLQVKKMCDSLELLGGTEVKPAKCDTYANQEDPGNCAETP